jgi:hypothetical protein
MDIIQTGKKGKNLNSLDKYHVYKISEDNLHMNDTYIDIYTNIHLITFRLV